MVALLSAEWIEAVARAVADGIGDGSQADGGSGADGPVTGNTVPVPSVQVVVTGSTGGAWWWSPQAVGPAVGAGTHPGPEVTVSVDEADLRRILQGELSLSVGFMQGRVKVDGATAPVLRLLSCSAGSRFDAVRRAVAAVTDDA